MLANNKIFAAFQKSLFPLISLPALLLFVQMFIMASCSSGELSRAGAQKLIVESKDFKQPAVIEFIQGNAALGRSKGSIQSQSDNEPEPEAVERRIASHYAANPQMAVASHFGLIDTQVKRTNDKPEPLTVASSYWFFDERYTVTEKGKKIWEEIGFPANETAVPIAEKELTEVTGVTKQGDTVLLVEYKWKWKPNEIGEALDSSTEEFKRLPEKIRSDLLAPEGLKSKNQSMSWGGDQKATAKFQKYDEGWRIVSAF
jgi:hypothetical protein